MEKCTCSFCLDCLGRNEGEGASCLQLDQWTTSQTNSFILILCPVTISRGVHNENPKPKIYIENCWFGSLGQNGNTNLGLMGTMDLPPLNNQVFQTFFSTFGCLLPTEHMLVFSFVSTVYSGCSFPPSNQILARKDLRRQDAEKRASVLTSLISGGGTLPPPFQVQLLGHPIQTPVEFDLMVQSAFFSGQAALAPLQFWCHLVEKQPPHPHRGKVPLSLLWKWNQEQTKPRENGKHSRTVKNA